MSFLCVVGVVVRELKLDMLGGARRGDGGLDVAVLVAVLVAKSRVVPPPFAHCPYVRAGRPSRECRERRGRRGRQEKGDAGIREGDKAQISMTLSSKKGHRGRGSPIAVTSRG